MTKKFILDQEDGTIEGGNARGAYSVDLQMARNNANQVASGAYAFIGGGIYNKVNGSYSFIGSGYNNDNAGSYAFIGGGLSNGLTGSYQTIAGGLNNTITSAFSTSSFIGGGETNSITAGAFQTHCVIAGGQSNVVSSSHSTISGGQSNTASSNTHATVVGGKSSISSGQYSVSGGFGNVAGNFCSVALGGQAQASGQSSACIGSESQASGVQSYVLGRLCQASGNYSMALGYGASANGQTYSNVYGGGGKSNNFNENVFANSRNQTNEGVVHRTGYYQRRFQIAGANSQTKGAITPTGQTIPSATTWGLTDSFNFRTAVGAQPHYTPLYDNVYFHYESNIMLAVNLISGTATGVSVGDYKLCKLSCTGKRYGGVNTVLTSNLVVMDESASMATATFDLVAITSGFCVNFNAPTFGGGGDLDLTIMSDNTVSEMKQNL